MGFTLRSNRRAHARRTRPLAVAAATVLMATTVTACSGDDAPGGESRVTSVAEQFVNAQADKDAKTACELTAVESAPVKKDADSMLSCVEQLQPVLDELTPELAQDLRNNLKSEPKVEEGSDRATVTYSDYDVQLKKFDGEWYVTND